MATLSAQCAFGRPSHSSNTTQHNCNTTHVVCTFTIHTSPGLPTSRLAARHEAASAVTHVAGDAVDAVAANALQAVAAAAAITALASYQHHVV